MGGDIGQKQEKQNREKEKKTDFCVKKALITWGSRLIGVPLPPNFFNASPTYVITFTLGSRHGA
jgi:hypothetical protein